MTNESLSFVTGLQATSASTRTSNRAPPPGIPTQHRYQQQQHQQHRQEQQQQQQQQNRHQGPRAETTGMLPSLPTQGGVHTYFLSTDSGSSVAAGKSRARNACAGPPGASQQ